MIYNTSNGGNIDSYSEKIEVHKIDPVKWGKNKIIGLWKIGIGIKTTLWLVSMRKKFRQKQNL